MARPQLRVYFSPEESQESVLATGSQPVRQPVTVRLGEVLPLLAEAVQTGRLWVQDFADEPITLSPDLYEVLLAYQELKQTA
jgi:hypothetical protein